MGFIDVERGNNIVNYGGHEAGTRNRDYVSDVQSFQYLTKYKRRNKLFAGCDWYSLFVP
jgi:hypothetical protein